MARQFLLLYGSETGQAESIAQDLASAAPDKGFAVQLYELNEVDKKFMIEKTRCPVVIVTSTTGEGDPPLNARKFARKIKRRTLPNTYLAHLSYTVLGLGDTNYENFCNCGKTIDARLAELGARRFYDSAWADDGVGLELTVEPWVKSLWNALDEHCAEQNGHVEEEEEMEKKEEEKEEEKKEEVLEVLRQKFEELSTDNSAGELLGEVESAALNGAELSVPQLPAAFLSAELLPAGAERLESGAVAAHNGQPFPASDGAPLAARAASVQRLTAPDAAKTSLLLRVQLSEPPLDFGFEPGDAFSLLLPNRQEEVTALLRRLGVTSEEADRPLRLRVRGGLEKPAAVPAFLPPEGASLRQLFRHCLEIRAPPDKLMLRLLAEFAASPREKRRLLELCATQGRHMHQHCVREAGLTLLDVLNAFPSCRPPVERLLERLKRLAPRPYSACCSPLAPELPRGAIDFAATLVEVPEDRWRAARRGLVTGWMAALADGAGEVDSDLLLLRRRNLNFRLPEPPTAAGEAPPLVLVGAGTGVSPFRGFLQHLERAWRSEQRPMVWLFFGCRHRAKDCLFGEEFEAWRQNGVLSRLSLVCSREAPSTDNRYVQHRMRAEAAELGRWLKDGARLYVCGDAKNMAREVREVAALVLAAENGASAAEGERLFARMRLERRYFEDVWS